MTCERCGAELAIGDYPFCPHGRGINGAIGDECDIFQENGFPTPQHFRHKSAWRRALAEKGLEPCVRHATLPGTDKSPYTTDWSKGSIDPQTLENARVLAERQAHTSVRTVSPDLATVHVTWAPVKSGVFVDGQVKEDRR